MKELYLYSAIYPWTAESIISAIENANGEDIVIRINSIGGDVFSGWGIAKKIREYEGKVHAKVDGLAASMAAAILLYADSVEASSVSRIMLHQASGGNNAELLAGINNDMRKQLKSKLSNDDFKSVTGVTIDGMFSGENKDYWLNAKDAKKAGIVNKVVKLTTAELSENKIINIAAQLNGATPDNSGEGNSTPKPEPKESLKTNSKKMTKDEFIRENPEAYAAMKADIEKAAVKKERDRIAACMKFYPADPKAVQAVIDSGESIFENQALMADLTIKMQSPEILAKLKDDSPKDVSAKTETPKAEREGQESQVVSELSEKIDEQLKPE